MRRLEGKAILVTGAARGLGRAIAQRCADDGAELVIIDVLEEEGARTAADLSAKGCKIEFMRCDITRTEDIASLFARISERWGRLDGLVNNAALATGLAGKTFEQIPEAGWDRVFDINVKGTWRVTSAAVPLLKASKNASIVNLASDTALWGADLFMHYVASKGAIIAMSRAMARELGPFEINVNAVAPGLTKTEATANAPERRWKQYSDIQLIKRAPEPTDIVGIVAMLLSRDGAFITGQTFAVNGGMTQS
jgi:NAD(P)-dependent dehydrogenase (short-subunit alcohol dehydrogenase family)